jgi:hypothetical protein
MSTTSRDLLIKVKKEIRESNIQDVNARMKADSNLAVLDVREKDEWDEGHLPGAVHIPRGFLETRIEKKRRRPQQAHHRLLRRGNAIGVRCKDPSGPGLYQCRIHGGRLRGMEKRRNAVCSPRKNDERQDGTL